MKKNNLLKIGITAILITMAASLFPSCSKTLSKDENGCYLDVKSAKEAAIKNKNNILVIATKDGEDNFSSDFIKNVIQNENFKKEISSEYTVLKMDFSVASYAATAINENSTEEEIEQAEKKANIMQQNTLLASSLNLNITPAIYIMSKEMYYITSLDYITKQITDYESFKELLESQKQTVDAFNNKIATIKSKSSKTEKLTAIDEIYESTDPIYRSFLLDLIEEYIKLDDKNESNLLSKYLLARADIKSSDYYVAGDIENAMKVYLDTAEDQRLLPEHRQNCYYLVVYIMAMSQSIDFEGMKSNLQKAIDAYPEGPQTPSIRMVLENIEAMFSTEVKVVPVE